MESISVTELLTTLQAEGIVMQDLLDCIRSEQQSLTKDSLQEVSALLEQKAALVAQLANLSARRHALLVQHGWPNGEIGMQAWLEAHPDTTVSDTWNTLLDQVRLAKDLNHTNGLIINTQLNRKHQALHILTGNTALEKLYGADGQPNRPAFNRGHVIG